VLATRPESRLIALLSISGINIEVFVLMLQKRVACFQCFSSLSHFLAPQKRELGLHSMLMELLSINSITLPRYEDE
jgi:hypothetical protein